MSNVGKTKFQLIFFSGNHKPDNTVYYLFIYLFFNQQILPFLILKRQPQLTQV